MTKAAETQTTPPAATQAAELPYAERSLEDLLSAVDGRDGGAEFAAEARGIFNAATSSDELAELKVKVIEWLDADDAVPPPGAPESPSEGEEGYTEPTCIHGYTRGVKCPDGCTI